jgi:glycosyltransferase involved in cell wall biosynthesis
MKTLTVILSPDSSLGVKEVQGTFSRFRKNMEEYSRHFDVRLYTCDRRNYTREIGVRHHPVPLLSGVYIIRHLMFYLFLVASSLFFRRGPIRVYGVSIPFLFLIRFLSRNRTVISYEWDYKEQAREVYGGIKARLAPLIERITMFGADIVFTTTDRIREKVGREYGKVCYTMPLFIDLERFRPGGSEEDFVFFAARLHWIKGLDYLLEAFSILQKDGVRTKLFVAGDGEIKRYKRKAEELGLENVVFLGPIENRLVGELMRKCRCFVLPTVTMEGQPVSLIEAMASGCACIVTDVPGNSDMVRDGYNGIVVPPRDSKALAGAILKVLKDKRLRMKLKGNALGSSKQHSLEKTIGREAEVLREL